jgi:hypothetical protein
MSFYFFSLTKFCSVVTDVKVLILDRSSFNMVLGPVEDVLKRNMDQYRSYKQMLEEGKFPEFTKK